VEVAIFKSRDVVARLRCPNSNWINVWRTTGRGKKFTSLEQLIPVKDIWLYPLRKNFAGAPTSS
jgi:hypothetical protein